MQNILVIPKQSYTLEDIIIIVGIISIKDISNIIYQNNPDEDEFQILTVNWTR